MMTSTDALYSNLENCDLKFHVFVFIAFLKQDMYHLPKQKNFAKYAHVERLVHGT